MTIVLQHSGDTMAFSTAYDNMELGTSPLRQPEDIDLEDLDPMIDRSVDNSMIDESEIAQLQDVDLMQADTEQLYQDDEMLDEENHNESYELPEGDLDMDKNEIIDDEEILYEEETMLPPTTEPERMNNHESTQSLPTDVDTSTVGESALEMSNISNTSEHGANSEDVVQETLDQTVNAEEQLKLPDQVLKEPITISKNTEEQRPMVEGDVEQGIDIVDFAAEADEATNLHDNKELQPEEEHDHQEPEQSENNDNRTETDHETFNLDLEGTNAKTILEDGPTAETVVKSTTEMEPPLTTPAVNSQPQVKIVYLGEEMSLFPPSDEQTTDTTFFLQDASLVNGAVDKLLSACRDVLGDTLEHDDELVLDVPSLGLHICEDSRYTSSLTLAQVMDVYTKLCSNESPDLLQPLYCNITSRVRLSTQFTYLSNAAHEGRHFSEIAADYVDTPEDSGSLYQPTNNAENVAVDVGAPEDDAGEVYSPQSLMGEDIGTSTNEHEVDTAAEDDVPGAVEAEENESSEPHNDTVVSKEEQIAKVNVAEANRLAQENILNDIDNDLDGEAELDEQQTNTATDISASLDQVDRTNIPIAKEGIEQISDADTSSSHTVEAVPEDLEGQHDESTADPELAGGEHDEAYNFPTDVHDIPDPDEGDKSDAVHNDDNEDEEHESAHEELVEPSVEDGLIDQNNHDESYEDEEWHAEDVEDGPIEYDEDNLSSVLDEPPHDLAHAEEPLLPTTPSKQANSKRKAPEDEEDLDFLDFSTPEPKRTRPS